MSWSWGRSSIFSRFQEAAPPLQMERSIICPLEAEHADRISALLAPPSPQSSQAGHSLPAPPPSLYFLSPPPALFLSEQSMSLHLVLMQEYYRKLLAERAFLQSVVDKLIKVPAVAASVYARSEFKEGELILKDQMLVGAQHSSNKVDCFVCSYCFRFIGSIELQIGRKLYLQSLGLSTDKKHDHGEPSHSKVEVCLDESSEEKAAPMEILDSMPICSFSDKMNDISLPIDLLDALMNGSLTLPHSKQFSLPSVVPCCGGCEEEHYCR
ncbi:hypothetical protein ACLOJK_029293 [Asimina triloba]